jgi:hypothetical protein
MHACMRCILPAGCRPARCTCNPACMHHRTLSWRQVDSHCPGPHLSAQAKWASVLRCASAVGEPNTATPSSDSPCHRPRLATNCARTVRPSDDPSELASFHPQLERRCRSRKRGSTVLQSKGLAGGRRRGTRRLRRGRVAGPRKEERPLHFRLRRRPFLAHASNGTLHSAASKTKSKAKVTNYWRRLGALLSVPDFHVEPRPASTGKAASLSRYGGRRRLPFLQRPKARCATDRIHYTPAKLP